MQWIKYKWLEIFSAKRFGGKDSIALTAVEQDELLKDMDEAAPEAGIRQDKNFTVRLKAAIDKRMSKLGIWDSVLHLLKSYDDYKEHQTKFFESLEDITLESLQGESPTTQGAGRWLLDLLAEHGGTIESTASLSVEEINQARASGRLYVDENSLGYAWIPQIDKLPTTEKEVEFLEKWFPLKVELPEHLKNCDFLFNKKPIVKK